MHLGPGGTFGAEAGAVEIAAKHINRQFVVLLIADVDFVTVMWKYSRTVTGAAVVVALVVPGIKKLTPLQWMNQSYFDSVMAVDCSC